MDILPPFIQVEILIYSPIKIFWTLCKTNRFLRSLYKGELTSEFGDLNEYLFQERCKLLFPKNVIACKDNDYNWRGFYFHVMRMKSDMYKCNEFSNYTALDKYSDKVSLVNLEILYIYNNKVPNGNMVKNYFSKDLFYKEIS